VASAEGLTTGLLGRVLDSLNIGVVFVHTKNTIQVFNAAAGQMLGEDPAARIGRSLLLCQPSAAAPGVPRRVSDLSRGRVAMSENWLNYRGRLRREYILPVRDANGETAGTLLLLHDAASQVDCLKRLGEWTEVRVSGQGERSPGALNAGADGFRPGRCDNSAPENATPAPASRRPSCPGPQGKGAAAPRLPAGADE
jgi:PAS domain-containing protein